MKFKNKATGVVLEPNTDFVADQLKKDERFQPVGGETGDSADSAGADTDKKLDKLGKPELLKLAAEKGAAVNEGMTKAEIIEAIGTANAS